MDFYSEITNMILTKKIQTKLELHKTKIKLCKKYKIDSIPPDSEILAQLPDDFSGEVITATIATPDIVRIDFFRKTETIVFISSSEKLSGNLANISLSAGILSILYFLHSLILVL